MESSSYHPQLLKWEARVLSVSGLWIPTDRSRRRLFFVAYVIFLITYVEVLYNISEYIVFPTISADKDKLIEHVGMLVQHLVGTVKVSNHLFRLKTVQSIMQRLDDDEFVYEAIGDFEPKKIMQKYVTYGKYFGVLWFMVGNGVPLSKIVPAAVDIFFTRRPTFNETIVCSDMLPYYSWMPFETNTMPSCRIAFVLQSVPMVIYGWQISGCDSTFIVTVMITTAHLLILQGAFRTIRQRCLRKLQIPNDNEILHDEDVPELHEEMVKEVKTTIKYLQKLLILTEDMEETFNIIALCQSLLSLFVLVACLYMVSSVDLLSKSMFGNAIYLLAACFQLGIYSLAGDQITSSCMDVKGSIYESNWYASSKSYKSYLLLTMLRMEKPVFITIGKFTPLTLETLVNVMKGSYSFFAFLKNSNN